MEEKNKKDIVEQIVEKMKSMEELPYKEGAWENFQSRYGGAPIKRNKPYYWAASAAAILLLGIATVKYWPDNNPADLNNQMASSQEATMDNRSTPQDNNGLQEGLSSQDVGVNPLQGSEIAGADGWNASANGTNLIAQAQVQDAHDEVRGYQDLGLVSNYANQGVYPSAVQIPNSLHAYSLSDKRAKIDLEDDNLGFRENNINTELAYQAQEAKKGAEPTIKNRNFNFRERFDLGLFVSPNSTNERFNFGGGVLLAYNINKNVSVRTGLAYNRYDASQMKDPVANSETPVVASKEALQKITANGLTQNFASSNAIILPNVNAISGNVQALEVPLDVRVKSKSGYYASTGITYAAVFNQNRYAHYVENANTELFGNGLPESEAEVKTAVKQVSRAIKTEDENVSSNGFGGFVNFSIGKEMKMNKNINLSVEPYFKMPVGSFKRADMNYTNGGIRIITNF